MNWFSRHNTQISRHKIPIHSATFFGPILGVSIEVLNVKTAKTLVVGVLSSVISLRLLSVTVNIPHIRMSRVSSALCRELRVRVPWGLLAGSVWSHPSHQHTENTRTWLALHGWLDNAGSFDLLAPGLVSDCPDLRLVCLDYPGHGLSSHLPPGQMYHFLESLR